MVFVDDKTAADGVIGLAIDGVIAGQCVLHASRFRAEEVISVEGSCTDQPGIPLRARRLPATNDRGYLRPG